MASAKPWNNPVCDILAYHSTAKNIFQLILTIFTHIRQQSQLCDRWPFNDATMKRVHRDVPAWRCLGPRRS